MKLGILGPFLMTLLVITTMMLVSACSEPVKVSEILPPGVVKPPNLQGLPEPSVIGESNVAAAGYGKSRADEAPKPVADEPIPQKPDGPPVTTASGLKYQILRNGKADGAVAKAGTRVKVHYTGKFENGTPFDSSRSRGVPYEFVLGSREVIEGWDEGIAGMKIDERRLLTVPANLAYGATGKGQIPPNATLVFDIELLGVQN